MRAAAVLVVVAACSSGSPPAPRATVAPPVAVAPSPPGVDAAPAVDEGVDLVADARVLYRVAACGPGALPDGFDARVIAAHCKALDRELRHYRARWVDRAVPFLARIVPADLPERVVYPFAGGDLLAALATFPNATELTTIGLETAGDVRAVRALSRTELASLLTENRGKLTRLLHETHSRTDDLRRVMRQELPGQLIFAMVGLVVHGYEPVSLRYFTLRDDGALHYLAADELDRTPLVDVEVRFQPLGGGPIKTWRHVSANLDNDHLAADAPLLRHLTAKGRVAAMTKAASFLLWWDDFSRIRDYLLGAADWMISDSTGIPPRFGKAVFTYETYGEFDGPFIKAGRSEADELRALWRAQPERPLPFRYGYPDSAHHAHLMIARRR